MIPISGCRLQTPRIEHVGANGAQGVDRRRADERVRLLVERAAEHRHLDARVLRERDRDRRAVRDHGRLAGRAAGGARPRAWSCPASSRITCPSRSSRAVARAIAALACRRLLAPGGVGPRSDRGRERAAVDAPHEPRVGELVQVAADRVERHAERGAQLGDDDLPVVVQPLEDHLAPFLGQHGAHSSINVQFRAETCHNWRITA